MPRRTNTNPEQEQNLNTAFENVSAEHDTGVVAAQEPTGQAAEAAVSNEATEQSHEPTAAHETAVQGAEAAPPTAPSMKIDVRITSTRNYYDDPLRALATVTLNDSFAIKGVRVVKGENGLFCSMPARRLRNGEYSEVCHPITADFARVLNASVLSEYSVHLAQQMEESQQTPHIIEPEPEPQDYDAPEPDMEMGI